MNDSISALISSKVFWFSVIVVSLPVGIIGNFLTDGIRRSWDNGRTSLNTMLHESKSRRSRRVVDMAQNLDHLRFNQESVAQTRATGYFLAIVALVLIHMTSDRPTSVVSLHIAILVIFSFSTAILFLAFRMANEIMDALKLRDVMGIAHVDLTDSK